MKPSKLAILLLLGTCAAGVANRDKVVPWLKGLAEHEFEKHRLREEFKRYQAERAQAELQRERSWQAGPITPCRSFGAGAAPQVCIEHEGAAEAPLGTPVRYRVRWRNLPQDAYIRVWSRNAAPAGERWAYLGAQGAIAPQALGGSREGDVRVNWDGASIYCAPADGPMMCDQGEVGRYVLRAAIMTGSDPFWPSFPLPNPVPVIHHAQSETAPFALEGLPRPVFVPGRFRFHPAHGEIVQAIRDALPSGALGVDWYVERRLEKLGPWKETGRRYCSRLDLDLPLEGSVSVCFPRRRRDINGIALRPGDIAATSSAHLAAGLLPAGRAKAKAVAYALRMTGGRATFSSYPTEQEMVRVLHPDPNTYDGSYQGLRNRARDAGLTYVEVNQPNVSFRHDRRGSWWLVDASLWIRTIDGPEIANWGRIALRIDHDGHVCRVDATGENEGEGPDQRPVYSPCRPGSRQRILTP